jgi:hypothetical protein
MESKESPWQQRLLTRMQYIWRLAIPFWLFRDVAHGTVEQRIANYRYNRSQRRILPFYVWKWVGIAACLMQVMRVLSGFVSTSAVQGQDHLCAALFCMSAGIAFAFSCVVIAMLVCCYLFLTWVKR